MYKTDSIARRILGWALNRWDRWYDCENNVFIYDSEFQPEQKLEHALLIVDRLEQYGFAYRTNGVSEVYFNEVRATGDTLPQAITNAAYSIIEKYAVADSYAVTHQLY